MTIEVIDEIVPKNGNPFPIASGVNLRGVDQVFASVAARDQFDPTKLVVGQKCYVVNDDDEYRLTSDAPITWTLIGGSGGGSVDSVNGQTGVVVLNANDVGADQLGTADTVMVIHTNVLLTPDPHPLYATNAETTTIASALIVLHVGLSDPHTQYQKESEKDLPNGYPSLGSDGFVPYAELPVDWLNRQHWFGDGGDGDAVQSSGVVNLTRAMFYRDLTISGTGQVGHSNNHIFVSRKYTQSTSASPAIKHSLAVGQGGNGAISSGAGGVSGAATSAGSLAANQASATGGAGSSAAGALASAAATVALGSGGAGGNAGASGLGSGGVGGTGRTGGTITLAVLFHRPTIDFIRLVTAVQGGSPGGSGSGGGGNGTNNGGGGGAAGASGTLGFLSAFEIDVTSATTPVFSVEPGTSGNGGAPSSANCGGGSGAGGSGAGYLQVIYDHCLGTLAIAFVADGGSGGSGGAATGTGVAGGGGNGGIAGKIKVYCTSKRTVVDGVQTVAPVAGVAAVGNIAGAGGNGGVNRVGLAP